MQLLLSSSRVIVSLLFVRRPESVAPAISPSVELRYE